MIKREDMQNAALINKVLTAVADMGDIFTDAPECEKSVTAAQNIQSLARLLMKDVDDWTVVRGTLFADGEKVAEANVSVNGTVTWDIPKGFDTSGQNWTLMLPSGVAVRVEMYARECADDEESWIVTDPELLYSSLLSQQA